MRFAAALPLVLVVLLGSGCGDEIPIPGAEVVPLFSDVTVHYTPGDSTRYDSPFAAASDNGRVMTTYRELQLRAAGRQARLHVHVRPVRKDIHNVQDRWDRAGHVALVKEGMPPVELARFMTSYGGEIEHDVDVTHLLPLLDGHCEFELFIDTWISPAWEVDVDLIIDTPEDSAPTAPTWATGALFPPGGLTPERPETSATIRVPDRTRRVSVAAITSGHCTDGLDADEFITKDNVMLLDGVEVYRWRPWRKDCQQLRAVNPYCAKWSDGSWSSDFPRSGWCPGDVVRPVMIDLGYLEPGDHVITWRVDGIRPEDGVGDHGYWRVSASASGWK
jgi:hypothetical protein